MTYRILAMIVLPLFVTASALAQVGLDFKPGTWLSSPRFVPGKLAFAGGKAFLFSSPYNEIVSYDPTMGMINKGVITDSLGLLVSDVLGSHIIGDGRQFLLIAGSDYLHSQRGAILRSYDAGETWTAVRPKGMEDFSFRTGIALSDAVQQVNDTTIILLGRISRDQGMSFQPIVTDSGDTLFYSSRQAYRGYSDGSCTIADFDRREVYYVPTSGNVAFKQHFDIMPLAIRSFGEQYQVFVNSGVIAGVRDRATGESILVRWSENDSLNTLITRSLKTMLTTRNVTVVDVPSYGLSAVFAGDRFVLVHQPRKNASQIAVVETPEEVLLIAMAESGTSVITHLSHDLEQLAVTHEYGCYRDLGAPGVSVITPNGALYLNQGGVLLNYERDHGLSMSMSRQEQIGHYVANVVTADDYILFEDHMSTVIQIDSSGLPRVIEYNADIAAPWITLPDLSKSFLAKSCGIKTTFYIDDTEKPEMTTLRGRYTIGRSLLVDDEYYGYHASLSNGSALYARNGHLVHCPGDEGTCDTLPAEITSATDVHLIGSRMLVERCLMDFTSNAGITIHTINDPMTVQSEYGREYTVHTIERDRDGVIWAIVSNTVFERSCSQPTLADKITPGTYLMVIASSDSGDTWVRVDSVSSASALFPLSGHVVSVGDDRIIALGTHVATYRYDHDLGAYQKRSSRFPGTSLPRYYDVAKWKSLLLVGTDRGLYIDRLDDETSSLDVEDQLFPHERLELSPNPASGSVHVRVSNVRRNARRSARLQVVSMLGEVVASYELPNMGSSHSSLDVDTSGIAPGQYLVVCTSQAVTLSSRLHVVR